MPKVVSVLFAMVASLMTSVACAQGILIPEHGRLPRPFAQNTSSFRIQELMVDSTVKGQIATTQITQVFENTGSRQLEASFVFPIPYDGAIDQMTFMINGKEYEAQLLPRDKAREIYNGYLRRNQDPALLEWMGTGMFKTSVFPIPPGETRTVNLKYSQLLRKDGTLVDYLFPLANAKFTQSPPDKIGIRIALNSEQEIKNIYSPTHDIKVDRDDDRNAVVSLETKEKIPYEDFRLVFDEMPGEIGCNLISYWPEGEDQGFFMMLASPRIERATQEPLKKSIIFVVDRSGSMSGEKIMQARDAAKFVVNNLNEGDLFNIISYESTVSLMKPELQSFGDAMRQEAIGFVNGINAGGSTNINEALLKAFSMIQDKSLPSYVVFLTDGLPTVGVTNELEIAKNALAANKLGTRLISFGVGYDVNSRLLDRLTRENHGQSEYVRPNEDIEAAVAKLYDKISAPVLANMNIDFAVDGSQVADGKVINRIYPAETADLFANTQLVVVGRYSKAGKTKVTLTGDVDGEAKEYSFDLNLNAKGEVDSKSEFVSKLWALRRIGEIIDVIDLSGSNDELVKELTDLSIKYGIVTPYTSYLADENAARNALAMSGENYRNTTDNLSALNEAGGASGFGQRVAKQQFKSAQNQNQSADLDIQFNSSSLPGMTAGVKGYADRKGRQSGRGGMIKQNGVTLYVRGKTLIADNAAEIDVEKDRSIVEIKRFSDEYFELIAANTEKDNRYLSAQLEDQELLIVLRGKTYLIK
ncbi:MAG: VIT domain-containing protein [Pirellulaceae bacterium]